ncbi:hypothetical protein PENSPDRAFT_634771 [Peniophora sp. CONT]|nr:hypothetical protein PENSPDRAFT_634771 [Peniophora sp. CONT]
MITLLAPIRAIGIRKNAVYLRRRTFLNLSSLSPFGGGSGGAPDPRDVQTYHERKILPYTRSQLYAVVSDVAQYSRFVPYCATSTITSPPKPYPAAGQDATRMEAQLGVAFGPFSESYISTVTCVPNLSVEAVASSSTPLFKSLTTTWRFQPASPASPHPSAAPPLAGSNASLTADNANAGPTLLTLDLAYAFASPLHAGVAGAFFGQVSAAMVKAFEERCRAVYGPGTR